MLFILICVLLIPIVMLIGGWIMWKHTPQDINYLIGYRTEHSMKNIDTWNFANKYCGRLWFKLGLIMLILSIIFIISFYATSNDILNVAVLIIMAIQCIVIVVSIFPTEKALKRNFNKDGTKKLHF